MSADTGTRSDQPQRKTLDDIRREIDAECAAFTTVPRVDEPGVATPRARRGRGRPFFGEDVLAVERRRHARRRRRRLLGFLLAGAVGFVGGQVVLLGYVAVTRHGGDLVRPAAAPSASAPGARPSADDAAAAPTPSTPAAPPVPAGPDAAARPSEPVTPAASPETSAAGAAEGDGRLELPPRAVVRRAPASPPPRRAALAGPGDWSESQSQLRAALRQWLRASKRGDAGTQAADAEVVLGADGRTAKTRWHGVSGAGDVVRELRWERGPSGWTVVGEPR